MTVQSVDAGDRVVSRRAEVSASADELFALVADPHKHGDLDGSGTVGSATKGPDRLADGAKFSVKMKQYGLPYSITSTVTRFEDGPSIKVVEWRHPAGHRWRWEFESLSPTRTTVTESWDTSSVPGVQFAFYRVTGQVKSNAAGITKTLEQLQARYA